MILENLKIKEELRDLIDAYAYLGDEKKISEQMSLFTPDAVYTVYMDGFLVAETRGTDNLEKEFNGHASEVHTYFTINGQHSIKIDGESATGTSVSQLKMIRKPKGQVLITDYSVRYDDVYLRQNEKWLINQRTGFFKIIDARRLAPIES